MAKRILKTFSFSLVVVLMISAISVMLYMQTHKKKVVVYEDNAVQVDNQQLIHLEDPDTLPAQDEYEVNNDDTNKKANQLEDAISALSKETEDRKW